MSTQVPPQSTSAGEWLTRQMERRATTVRQLADAMDVTTQTVYDWLGDRAAIKEDRIPRLAEVLLVNEIEARRGLGYWVPDGREAEQSTLDREELRVLKRDLQGLLDKVDRLLE